MSSVFVISKVLILLASYWPQCLSCPPPMTCFSVCKLISFHFQVHAFSSEIFEVPSCLQASEGSPRFLYGQLVITWRWTYKRLIFWHFSENIGRGEISIALTWSQEVHGWGSLGISTEACSKSFSTTRNLWGLKSLLFARIETIFPGTTGTIFSRDCVHICVSK